MKEVLGLILDEEIVAQKCQSLTAEMLRIVIDTALTEKFGPSWFEMYKTEYNNQAREKNSERKAEGKSKIPEIHENVKSVKGFDFQACIKLFVFMYEKYGSAVLEKYNLLSNELEFKRITRNLMDFRNKSSHKDETMTGKLTKNDCELAITYMKSLASFFPDICDSKTNETYKNEIYNIAFELYKTNNTKRCYFSDYKEFNGISDEKLLTACAKLSIYNDYVVDDNGNKRLCFYSFDEAKDVKSIILAIDNKNTQQDTFENGYSEVFIPPQEYTGSQNNKKSKSKLLYIIPVIIVIVALAFIISGIAGTVKSSKEALNDFSNEASNEISNDNSADPSKKSNLVNGIIDEASRQVSEHQKDSYENVTDSSTVTATTASSKSLRNQIPSDYKTKFDASSPNWSEEISVGETNLCSYMSNIDMIWDNARGYSEDTSIATVGDDLIVTARAKGVVKILYVGEFMGEDMMYIVEYTVK